MRSLGRVLGLLSVGLALSWSVALAQNPPNSWHPYTGGVNCIQVADADGNFNCAPGTTINLTTGAISYITPAGAIFPFAGAVVINTTSVTPQALGNDLVLATTPSTVAPAGPLFRGLTLRVRRGPAGTCQLVVAGGDGLQEFIIPVVNPTAPNPVGPSLLGTGAALLEWFPGGSLGC